VQIVQTPLYREIDYLSNNSLFVELKVACHIDHIHCMIGEWVDVIMTAIYDVTQDLTHHVTQDLVHFPTLCSLSPI